MNGGLYIAIFQLPSKQTLRVGKWREVCFPPGYYLYVGSAQKNLSARIARHARQEKSVRWHIDYLSVHATMLGAICISGRKQDECEIAAQLARLYDLAVPGFGSSDCRCAGHLFYSQDLC